MIQVTWVLITSTQSGFQVKTKHWWWRLTSNLHLTNNNQNTCCHCCWALLTSAFSFPQEHWKNSLKHKSTKYSIHHINSENTKQEVFVMSRQKVILFFHQTEVKLKPTVSHAHSFSYALHWLHVMTLQFECVCKWLLKILIAGPHTHELIFSWLSRLVELFVGV